MKQFIHDMIHMTEGEKFINYWWLGLAMVVAIFLVLYAIESFRDN